MTERNDVVGKTIKNTRFSRDKESLITQLEFAEGGILLIEVYRKDVPWQIALSRIPHEVGLLWKCSSGGSYIVCHSDHHEEQMLAQTWQGKQLDDIPQEGTFRIQVGGDAWHPTVSYFTPQGVDDKQESFTQIFYRPA